MTLPQSALIEEARSALLDAKLGLISPVELVSWADTRIAELQDPPYFLTAISLGEEAQIVEVARLDLVRDKPDEKDCKMLARRILQQLDSGRLHLRDLEVLSYQCAGWLDSESNLSQKLIWISDELYLNREGVKDPTRSHAEIRKVLEEMAK